MTVKNEVPAFSLFRSVGAHMKERYIFNFRMPPTELRKRLPAPWIEPQVFSGFSVVSFCILWLEQLRLPPLPRVGSFSTISCAYRIGVVDTSDGSACPSVYVIDRWADLPLIALLGPFILQDTIPIVKASVAHDNAGGTRVQMSYTDGSALFEAGVTQRKQPGLGSALFETVADFATFIKNGVSSYSPSLHPGQLTKVDLHKEDVDYEPLDAVVDFSELNTESWAGAGLEFDSAVRAKTGGNYLWTYQGLWKTQTK